MSGLTVSVIIPVYNAAPYLARCVESVLSQGYDGFEIVLADDGSTDGSAALCDALAARDRVHVAFAGGVRWSPGPWPGWRRRRKRPARTCTFSASGASGRTGPSSCPRT